MRAIALPNEVDMEQIDAHYDHGVLHITLPKSAKQQPKEIQIRTASANEVCAGGNWQVSQRARLAPLRRVVLQRACLLWTCRLALPSSETAGNFLSPGYPKSLGTAAGLRFALTHGERLAH